MDIWNTMIKIIKETKDKEVKSKAEILLNQYNTAGGIIIKNELISFINENKL